MQRSCSMTINSQPSTINHQPSTINHQPSTTRPVVGCVAISSGSATHHQVPLLNNQNQPKPTNFHFLKPVGFGWFKLVLVGLGYQVPKKPGNAPSFHAPSRPLSQPKPTGLTSQCCTAGANSVQTRCDFAKHPPHTRNLTDPKFKEMVKKR